MIFFSILIVLFCVSVSPNSKIEKFLEYIYINQKFNFSENRRTIDALLCSCSNVNILFPNLLFQAYEWSIRLSKSKAPPTIGSINYSIQSIFRHRDMLLPSYYVTQPYTHHIHKRTRASH